MTKTHTAALQALRQATSAVATVRPHSRIALLTFPGELLLTYDVRP